MNFFDSLKSYLSDEEIAKLSDSLKEESLHAIILNPKKMSDDEFLIHFPNAKRHPVVKHGFLYDKNEYDLGKSIYHILGCFYIQEPSAMVPAYLLNAQEDDVVLDMCAAPGGKSVQTSFLMKDKGLIISNDLSRSRAGFIVENIERLGIGNIVVTNNDLSLIKNQYLNTFDRIILDAPCSGSGMFRKEDKMLQDWSYNKVLKFQEVQKELVTIAYDMLKPGGTMCYSTCSFSKEEDEDVIEYLLSQTDAMIEEINNPLFYINKKKPLGVHLLPSIFPGEGHYICLIKKPGTLIKKNVTLEGKEPYGFANVFKYGDFLFGNNVDFNLKSFNIVRNGVKIGEKIKNEVKYDFHYSHFLSDYRNKIELNEQEIASYMLGNVINKVANKGYYLLTYNNIPVTLAKSDGKMIKNYIPRPYRRNYKL